MHDYMMLKQLSFIVVNVNEKIEINWEKIGTDYGNCGFALGGMGIRLYEPGGTGG